MSKKGNHYFCNTNFETKEELFKEISKGLIEQKFVKVGFEEALLARESEFPTGLPTTPAVAIPHTDGTLVLKDSVVFIKNTKELTFCEMGGDDKDIVSPKIIIMLVIGNGQDHLQELQKLIETIQTPGFLTEIEVSENEEEMKNIIANYL